MLTFIKDKICETPDQYHIFLTFNQGFKTSLLLIHINLK